MTILIEWVCNVSVSHCICGHFVRVGLCELIDMCYGTLPWTGSRRQTRWQFEWTRDRWQSCQRQRWVAEVSRVKSSLSNFETLKFKHMQFENRGIKHHRGAATSLTTIIQREFQICRGNEEKWRGTHKAQFFCDHPSRKWNMHLTGTFGREHCENQEKK